MAGYSGTSLGKKLGVKEGSHLLLVGAPGGYQELLEPMPAGVQFGTRLTKATDIVHVFTVRKDELQRLLTSYRTKLKSTGTVWVSWPKKSAKVPTDITEDIIREVALPLGFVDVKVCGKRGVVGPKARRSKGASLRMWPHPSLHRTVFGVR